MEKPDFEKKIPVPERNEYRRSKYYWLAYMEVGDSFTCSGQDYKRISARFGTPDGPSWLPESFKIATRKIDNGLYRIWRIA
tara:strand:+ start:304 stop:546 length:243 start_codon:yes stop_codon:yes gene_type:complete